MTPSNLDRILPTLLSGEKSVAYVPNKGNAGDALIAAATWAALQRMGVGVSGSAATVLVSGGGALIPRYECLAKALAKVDRGKRVIVLPSTVAGHWSLLRSFSDLTLLCREEMSLSLARMEGVRAKLCEDVALGFDYSEWTDHGIGTLHAMRTDSERGGEVIPGNNRDLSMEQGGWWPLHVSTLAARKFITAISRYRVVVTDRLHVAIVAAKLGKKVIFKPGDYFKNRAVYELSLAGFQNVSFE